MTDREKKLARFINRMSPTPGLKALEIFLLFIATSLLGFVALFHIACVYYSMSNAIQDSSFLSKVLLARPEFSLGFLFCLICSVFFLQGAKLCLKLPEEIINEANEFVDSHIDSEFFLTEAIERAREQDDSTELSKVLSHVKELYELQSRHSELLTEQTGLESKIIRVQTELCRSF